LKSALVAEVNLSEMTKQANPVSILFISSQSVFLLPLRPMIRTTSVL
jgi:hypothetical protein